MIAVKSTLFSTVNLFVYSKLHPEKDFSVKKLESSYVLNNVFLCSCTFRNILQNEGCEVCLCLSTLNANSWLY